MRYLRNLTSPHALEGNPWEFSDLASVPSECLNDKAKRTTWAISPTTNFHFYSGFVGVNENGRVSDRAGSEDGNPPKEYGAAVLDYDAKFTDAEVEAAIARMGIKPNWIERSLSGNIRLIWIFERPIILPSQNFAVYLLKNLSDLLPINELSNLDRPAAERTTTYYANGCNWRRLHDIPVSWARIQGWLVKISNQYAWKDFEPGVVIPSTAIAERFKELNEKYPRFASWPGEFKPGAQGPSFWIEGSTSSLSAIVRENGMQTFAGHASKSFYTWPELLGAEWVKAFEQNRIGRAVTDIYYDGHDYAIKNEAGRWDIENKDGVTNELVVRRGLTREISKKKGQTFSELESAFSYIRTSQRVKGMTSFAYFKKGRMQFNGDEYLNLHSKDAMQPAMESARWGSSGQFPWLSAYLDRYFSSPNQLPFYLSWGALFYKGCFYRQLNPGHSLFVAGPVCAGKTLNTRGIWGPLVGGFAEAKEFLLGEDSFNSELFDYALWAVDDASMGAHSWTHKKFCEMCKRVTANQEIRCNEKFRKAVITGSNARLITTCNQDADSARTLPDMETNMRDKVMLFRVQAPSEKFPLDLRKVLNAELPWFARYLLDWQIPEECRSERPEDSRFGGILPYHDETLVNTAAHNSNTASFAEILDVFSKEYFTKRNPDADTWRGTVLELYREIMVDPAMAEVMRQFPLDVMKRHLTTLSNGSQFRITIHGDPRRRTYEIDRSTHYPKERNTLEVSTRTDSKFQKQ